jgi:hypothetical protein
MENLSSVEKAVQPVNTKKEKSAQASTIKSDLTRAFTEVKLMRAGLLPKQTLSDFLKEL